MDLPAITSSEDHRERALSAVAAAQHSLITAAQLRHLGFDRGAVSYRVRQGRLHHIHRGVYAVGHAAIGATSSFAAAVLACGPRSVLSHWSAAAFWKLLPLDEGIIHVTVAGTQRRNREGLRVHRTNMLPRSDFFIRELIPVTSPARTIVDLADASADPDFERAVDEGRATRIIGDAQLRRVVASAPGRLGAKRLVAFLSAEESPGFSRSAGERILRKLIESAGLPKPRRNGRAHGHELDFYWPALRLNVEVDGSTAHTRNRNFESDRSRDADLATHGIQVLRFTWKRLTNEPNIVVAQLAAAIALRSAGG